MRSYTFFIDVSGQPYGEIYIGMVSLITYDMGKLEKNFRKDYSEFYRSKQKGAKRKPNELITILKFLNKNGVHMKTVSFKSKKWFEFREQYQDKAFLKEKIYGLLYFMLLKEVASPYKTYSVIVCNENYLNISKVLYYCNKLAKANKFNFSFSTAYVNSNRLLKFADYVASAHRKVKRKYLESIKNYQIINDEIPSQYIKKIF